MVGTKSHVNIDSMIKKRKYKRSGKFVVNNPLRITRFINDNNDEKENYHNRIGYGRIEEETGRNSLLNILSLHCTVTGGQRSGFPG